MTRFLIALCLCVSLGSAAHAKARAPAPKGAQSGAAAEVKLDSNAMAATTCVVKPSELKPMPKLIGKATLPPGIAASLKMIFNVSLRNTAQAAPAHCQGMQPKYIVMGRGKGSIKSAVVAQVQKPITVWRAYSDSPAFCSKATRDGRWWSFSDPRSLGKPAYRAHNGICQSWNTLSHVMRCTLKPGTPIAIGPTESVLMSSCACTADARAEYGDKKAGPYDPAGPLYAKFDRVSKKPSFSYDEDDRVLQVFIDTKGRLGDLTTNCKEFPWR